MPGSGSSSSTSLTSAAGGSTTSSRAPTAGGACRRARRAACRCSSRSRRLRTRTGEGCVMPPTTRDDGYFGARVAARYDESAAEEFDPAVVEATVDFLVGLAAGGRALELGIGTGRIALPLAGRGVHVHGIDLSAAMIDRLRSKPGAEAVGTTVGDMATTRVDGSFSVAYLVFNMIMNLTTQRQQVACFRNAAAHLSPAVCFVVEVSVPDLQRLPPGETIRPYRIGARRADARV